jgi:hypothetical protein
LVLRIGLLFPRENITLPDHLVSDDLGSPGIAAADQSGLDSAAMLLVD